MKKLLFLWLWAIILPIQAQKTYYVSPNGTARADGLSKNTPLKDLQKAIDIAEDGAITPPIPPIPLLPPPIKTCSQDD